MKQKSCIVLVIVLAALFAACPPDDSEEDNTNPDPLRGEILNKTVLDLNGGASETLSANVPVTWASGNGAVATVTQGGTVSAVHSGMVKITVTAENGKTESCTVWVNRKGTAAGGDIQELGVYPIQSPKAGNYPQGLFKYPFRYGDKLASHLSSSMEAFQQDLAWEPEVSKTFALSTKYKATLTLSNDSMRYFENGPSGPPVNVSRLPEDGVESIFIEKVGTNLVITINFEETASVKATREIIWGDEFNGTELDTDKWNEPIAQDRSECRWEPGQGLVSVSGGDLHLKYLSYTEKPGWILGGAVQSKKHDRSILFDRSYGYFEARIKFPPVLGAWGAFWLMSDTTDFPENGGIDGTEIDIVETAAPNDARQFNAALHWNGYLPSTPGPRNCHAHLDDSLLAGDGINIYDGEYHIFAVCWSPSAYIFYVDNREFWRVDTDANKMARTTNESFIDFKERALGINQNPSYIILSVEAAAWAGSLGANIDTEMLVDWVRVWNQPPIAE